MPQVEGDINEINLLKKLSTCPHIIKLIDARKAAGLPPSKSLESQENVSKNK